MITIKAERECIKMGIGTRIKQLRKRAHLTQPELAERIGVHETTIRRWEQEKDRGPDVNAVNTIAEALNTTPEYLLSNTGADTIDEDTSQDRLVYEWGGHRLALPNTPETRAMFERLVSPLMSSAPVATV